MKSLLAALLLVFTQVSYANVYVEDFSPQGEVKQVRQATAVFSEDMVAVGDTDAADPFNVDCPVTGKGRWTNTRTWQYKLTRALHSGERCRFSIKPALQSVSSAAVDVSTPTFEAYTAGPWLAAIYPEAHSKIEEDQYFLVDTSAPVKPDTVLKNAWCEVEGVGERIPVSLMSQQDLSKAVKALAYGENAFDLGLRCAHTLPAGSKVQLVWGAGIESVSGGKTLDSITKAYEVRPAFRVELTCEREKPTAPCSALSDIRLLFSDQISLAQAEKITLNSANAVQYGREVSPARKKELLAKNPKQYWLKNSLATQDHLDTVVFKGPFNQNTQFTIQLPANFTDLSGRKLSNANQFPLKTRVAALPPLAKFSADFGILELKEGGVLPVTLRNIESQVNMRVLRQSKVEDMLNTQVELASFERQTKEITPNKPKLKQRDLDGYESEEYTPRVDYLYPRELSFLVDKTAAVAMPKLKSKQDFEVLGIPLSKPGFYVVEIESKLLGNALLSESKPMYVRSTALVTDMAVHFKKGRDNSLIWVTRLSTGKPVANAEVGLYDCHGSVAWQGKTDTEGRALIEQKLPEHSNCRNGYVFHAVARLGEDFSFTRSDWDRGIEPWRFNVDTWSQVESPKIHTILDRTMLRAGETVSMKHIARVPNLKGYEYPQNLPDKMTLELIGGDFALDIPLTWDVRGIATSQWQIPKDAKIGAYAVKIGSSWQATGEFRVSEFRLPVFKGSASAAKRQYANPKEIPLRLSLAYLNGGGADGQEVSVSAMLKPAYHYRRFPNYDEFNFTSDDTSSQPKEQLLVNKQALKLDQHGQANLSVPLKGKVVTPMQLQSEMTFSDPNGEIQTISDTTEIWPADIAVGLQVKDWAGLKGKHKVQAVALGLDGKPRAGVKITITGKRSWDFTHRKRVIGGFYSYETQTEHEDLGELCAGTSNAQGLFNCQVEVKESGNVQLLARVQDAQGNMSVASSGFWASEDGDIWFGQGDEDRIEVIPEKREYAVGEKARFQVHMPFYQSTALIAVEREGVLKTIVQPLYRRDATIEIPIEPEWGPNVFVSVLAVRGRVTDVPWYSFLQWGWRNPGEWFQAKKAGVSAPTALVDLAKPAYKFGLTRVAVGNQGIKLNVNVSSDKKTYKPREKAQVKIQVKLPNGKPAPAGSEVAVVAVDRALLELQPNPSWDLLGDMLQERAYLIETATAQMQVVGKRHYGKKALPAGGGGGELSARELFDTLLYWNPRVKLGKHGEATVQVPINDAMTAFKIVAIADVDAGLFGTGETEISSTQPLQIISGLPPLVRESDTYRAMLTLRNTTENDMTLRLHGKAGMQDLASQTVKVAANSAQDVSWQLKVPDEQEQLSWQIDAVDSNGKLQDRLRFTQKVQPKAPVTVQQANFMRLEKPYNVATGLPKGAIAGKGGLDVRLTAKLADQTEGIERYFREYPYSCLEQKTSIATGLNDKSRWQDIVNNLSSYQDADGFLSYFPGSQYGSEALTGYVLTMAYENGIKLPPEVESRMQTALLDYAEGRIKAPGHWYWGDKVYDKERRLAALAALSYTGKVDARMLTAFEFKPLHMATASLIDWLTIVQHLPPTPERDAQLTKLERELRNRMQNVAGRLVFTTETQDYWWWAMLDGETNATRLVAVLMDNPNWQKDMSGLLRGALMRQDKGRWHTTLSNAWGRVALDKFGSKFEKEAVSGKTTAKLDAVEKTHEWLASAAKPNLNKNEADASLYLPFAKDGKSQQFSVQHQGTGKPWMNVMVLAAVPTLKQARGYTIARSVTPIEQKIKGKWSRGDLMRVRIEVESDQSMSWVAVSDPIPGGASILGNTQRDSAIAQQGENQAGMGDAWPNYTERGLGYFRAYYEYVPTGKFSYEYTLRLNNPGEFNMPPTRVEAMYAPEVFGQLPNDKVVVQ